MNIKSFFWFIDGDFKSCFTSIWHSFRHDDIWHLSSYLNYIKQFTHDIKLLLWKTKNRNLGNVIIFFRLLSSKCSFSTRSDAHFKAQSLALDLCYLRNLCNQTDMHRLSSNLHCNSFSFIFSSMNVMLNFNVFNCWLHAWVDVCLAKRVRLRVSVC